MTVTSNDSAAVDRSSAITVTIDGIALDVPKGTLIIRAAEQLGIAVPRFCDHPLLDAVAACRQCLVEIEGQPKPQPSCAVECSDGMVVRTQLSSEVADLAQRGVMEFLLINHPLDCPMCDKGGECPLQNQAMTNGRGETRFEGEKRHWAKPINISDQILLDRERCISCTRCVRFSEQIAGDPFIDFLERGPKQEIGTASDVPFNSYFSGNTVQICPVGALTSSLYRFRARPFDLVSVPTSCEHCAAGCSLRTDVRRGAITRRLAGNDADVNEEWNCDKGRFAFRYVQSADRLTTPMVRGDDGALRPASWPEAIAAAAAGLSGATGAAAGVITGGRLSYEDATAYSMFARAVLKTNNVDFRSRPGTAEEANFLANRVAGQTMAVTYADIEAAPVVVLVAFEPEDESPIVALRLRKAMRHNGLRVFSVAAAETSGLRKISGTWLPASPDNEVSVVTGLGSGDAPAAVGLRSPGALILVGERAALTPGLLTATAALADATGAALAWVPRRAGDRGAVEAGLLPGLLPSGRPVEDASASGEVARLWGGDLPTEPGLARDGMLDAMQSGALTTAVLAGVDVDDWPERSQALAALDRLSFLVALDTHANEVTQRADVVLPVAAAPEKAGAFLDWEGRVRPFRTALPETGLMSDHRVLASIAAALGHDLPLDSLEAVRNTISSLPEWAGDRAALPEPEAPTADEGAADSVQLVAWRPLLDSGVLQQGEPHLAATARPLLARVSAATAGQFSVNDGDTVTVSSASGSLTRPVQIAEVVDGVVVLTDHTVRDLGVTSGAFVTLRKEATA